MSRILLNRIRTPDGTILTSYHRHDYKTHKDANGKTYMVDGGTTYLRRNVHPDAPYEELSVEIEDGKEPEHELVRNTLFWGTYGPKGDQPRKWVLLKDLDTDHIQAILDDGYERVRPYMKAELKYREENEK